MPIKKHSLSGRESSSRIVLASESSDYCTHQTMTAAGNSFRAFQVILLCCLGKFVPTTAALLTVALDL